MVFELAVDDSLKESEYNVIGSWRPGETCVVVESSTAVACTNVEKRKYN